jgi:hypothetical protein
VSEEGLGFGLEVDQIEIGAIRFSRHDHFCGVVAEVHGGDAVAVSAA